LITYLDEIVYLNYEYKLYLLFYYILFKKFIRGKHKTTAFIIIFYIHNNICMKCFEKIKSTYRYCISNSKINTNLYLGS